MPGQGQIHVAPKGHKKDTKRTQKGHKCLYSLEGLQIKQICTETLVCVQQVMYTCSIHQRIAPNAQGKLKSKKGKNIIALNSFKSFKNELKHWLVSNKPTIHQNITANDWPGQRQIQLQVISIIYQKGHKII